MNKDRLIAFALFVLTFALYARTIWFDYVNYDDDVYVYDNPRVLEGLSWRNAKWAFTTGAGGNWHPLTWLSLQADVSIFSRGPNGHHVTNVFLHAASAAILFLALRRMTIAHGTGARWAAAVCAALFAFHPLRVESVAWISERKDVLCGFFWMLSMLAYAHYVRRSASPRHRYANYALVLLTCLFALVSKPMAVTLPFVLLLLDYWPLRRFADASRRGVLNIVAEKLPLILLAACVSVATIYAQRGSRAMSSTIAMPLADRLANAAISYSEYIRQTIWPTGLAPFYPHPRSFPGGQINWIYAVFAAAGISIVTLAIILYRRRDPWLTVGWLWFLGTLVPVIGLVQVGEQAHADRYTYIPSIGLSLIAAMWLQKMISDPITKVRKGSLLIFVPAALLIVAASALTVRQTSVWRDSEALWRHTVKVVPNSFTGYTNLGATLQRKGDADAAMEMYRRAIEINPNESMALNNIGVTLVNRGESAAAKDYFKRSLKLDPYGPGFVHLGNIYARENRLDDAIMLYEQAVKRDPEYVNGLHNLALAVAQRGEIPRAIELWRRALAIRTDDADVHHHLGVALIMSGSAEEGIAELRKAIATDSQERVDTMTRLAWTLATHPRADLRQPSVAVQLAARAVELTSTQDATVLDTYAAALAASRQFGEAAKAAETALALVRSSATTQPAAAALADAIQARLELYRAGKPYVQPLRSTTRAAAPATKSSQ